MQQTHVATPSGGSKYSSTVHRLWKELDIIRYKQVGLSMGKIRKFITKPFETPM